MTECIQANTGTQVFWFIQSLPRFSVFLSFVWCLIAAVSFHYITYNTPTVHCCTQPYIIYFFFLHPCTHTHRLYSHSCIYNWIFNESVGAAYCIQTGRCSLYAADGIFIPERGDSCCNDNWPLKSSPEEQKDVRDGENSRVYSLRERGKIDALAATDSMLLIDCFLLRHLMCCYCRGISLRFPEVIWVCRRCWISVGPAVGGALQQVVESCTCLFLWHLMLNYGDF